MNRISYRLTDAPHKHMAARRGSAFPVLLFSALAALVLFTGASAQGEAAADAERFHDRWLRAFMTQSVSEIPRFTGSVAEVSRSVETDGTVSERRLWRFDERGWPLDTELTVFAGTRELKFLTIWHYGADGLPLTIDVQGTSSDSLFFTWFSDAVEVEAASGVVRYAYDAERDVLSVEQSAPNEVEREFVFAEDGSSSFTFRGRDDEGEWQQTLVGEADGLNLSTYIQNPVITTAVEVIARDANGNPLEALRTRSGNVADTATILWEVVYR